MRLLVAGIFLFTSWPFLFAQNPSVGVDRVVVYKHERKLVLLSQGKQVRSYIRLLWVANPSGRGLGMATIGLRRGLTYSIPETLTATFTKPFTSRIQTRKTSQPPRSQASAPEATSCYTDFRRSMHGWERHTFCMTGQMDASRSRTKRWTNFGNWFASALPSRSSLDPQTADVNSILTSYFHQSLRCGCSGVHNQ